MVDGTIYTMSSARDRTVSSDKISEDDILGEIESEVPLNEFPEEDAQINMSGYYGIKIGSPYARYRNDIVILTDEERLVFEEINGENG